MLILVVSINKGLLAAFYYILLLRQLVIKVCIIAINVDHH